MSETAQGVIFVAIDGQAVSQPPQTQESGDDPQILYDTNTNLVCSNARQEESTTSGVFTTWQLSKNKHSLCLGLEMIRLSQKNQRGAAMPLGAIGIRRQADATQPRLPNPIKPLPSPLSFEKVAELGKPIHFDKVW